MSIFRDVVGNTCPLPLGFHQEQTTGYMYVHVGLKSHL